MFYKDDNNIDIIQLGNGDVTLCNVLFETHSDSDVVGIGFIPGDPGAIGEYKTNIGGQKDHEASMKLKLLFTNSRSIDVVISQLLEAKFRMLKEKNKMNVA